MPIKDLKKSFNSLCTPAQVYLALSLITVLSIALQNINGKNNKYCVGRFECNMNLSKWSMVSIQLLYSIFWTLILDTLCKHGYSNVSWAIVLLPYILFFIILTAFMISNM
jgi:hypothetical protein